MISINIAGAFTHYSNLILFLVKNNILKKFNITVYDGVNKCSWNGGRINRDINISQHNIELYNKHNIKVAFTFTNHNIDLDDTIGNTLLTYLDASAKKYNMKNTIILINENLLNYIKSKYDNFIYKFSITGHDLIAYPDNQLSKSYINYYKNLEQKYDIIVPKMEHIFQDWFVNNLSLDKYEIMINDTCFINCPYYREHFKQISERNTLLAKNDLSYNDKKDNYDIEECWLKSFDPNTPLTSKESGMDLDSELLKKAINLGYNKFKISGREMTVDNFINELDIIKGLQ